MSCVLRCNGKASSTKLKCEDEHVLEMGEFERNESVGSAPDQ